MKLSKLREQQIRSELEQARLVRGGSERATKIIDAIEAVYPGGSVFLPLSWTPEQSEDIVVVLVGDSVVATVRLSRGEESAAAALHNVHDYKRNLRGRSAITLEVAAVPT